VRTDILRVLCVAHHRDIVQNYTCGPMVPIGPILTVASRGLRFVRTKLREHLNIDGVQWCMRLPEPVSTYDEMPTEASEQIATELPLMQVASSGAMM
jgi:hypothetical protein